MKDSLISPRSKNTLTEYMALRRRKWRLGWIPFKLQIFDIVRRSRTEHSTEAWLSPLHRNSNRRYATRIRSQSGFRTARFPNRSSSFTPSVGSSGFSDPENLPNRSRWVLKCINCWNSIPRGLDPRSMSFGKMTRPMSWACCNASGKSLCGIPTSRATVWTNEAGAISSASKHFLSSVSNLWRSSLGT